MNSKRKTIGILNNHTFEEQTILFNHNKTNPIAEKDQEENNRIQNN